MKILHILADGPTSLAERIIQIQSGEHDVKVVDLSKQGTSYEALIDEIFARDRVVSWNAEDTEK